MDNVHTEELPAASSDLVMALERDRPDLVEWEDAALDAPLRRPPSGPLEDATLIAGDDDPKPTRGFMNGVLLAVPLWGLIGLLTWFVLAL